jgi:phospholipid/cholesterol/gamma-HCH transport system substrate-binding protein
MSKKNHEVTVGVLVLMAGAALGWMSLKIGALSHLGDTVDVVIEVPDASGLATGAEVKVAGVVIGRITDLGVVHDHAELDLSLDRDAGLRSDVVAQIRARSVLGEKYLALMPQSATAPLLEDGDHITATVGHTEIDELLNSMGPLLSQVDGIASLVDRFTTALDEDPERAARMMGHLETLLREGASAAEHAPAMIGETRQTLRDFRKIAQELRPALESLGPTLERLGPMLDKTGEAVATLDRVATKLDNTDIQGTVGETRALIRDAREAVADGRRALGKIEGTSGDIQTLVDNLAEIDKWELRRLLREEGILVRLKPSEVVPTD